MRETCLITGGTGFIGSHVLDYLYRHTDWKFIVLDRLDSTATFDRLTSLQFWEGMKLNQKINVLWWDLRSPINEYTYRKLAGVNYVIHMAASTHVDRSIEDPASFVLDNTVGTCTLLELARKLPDLKKLIYFSTDEVMGAAADNVNYSELDMVHPENPYAASKLGAEALTTAYACTYNLPAIISRTMNVFGLRQHPEKFIPSTIKKVMTGETVIIHADATRTIPGSRFYISTENVGSAMWFLLKSEVPLLSKERTHGIYNVVGEKEVSNLELAQSIAEIVGKPLNFQLVDFHSSRPGHDRRYALSGTKLRNLGWSPASTYEQGLEQTVKWFLANREWLGLSD